MLSWYHGNNRTHPDRRADGEAHRQGAEGLGRISRHEPGRPARGHRPARLRREGLLRRRIDEAYRRPQEDLRPRPRRRRRAQAHRGQETGQAYAAEEGMKERSWSMNDREFVEAFEACAV